jgi:hypothetical protein
MKQQPSFERIIGGTESEQRRILDSAENEFHLTGEELYGELLVEPTTEERRVIKIAVDEANAVAHRYGSERVVDESRVFLLRYDGVRTITEGEVSLGKFNPFEQSIAVDRFYSPAMVAHNVFHESLHQASYQSAQIYGDGRHGSYRNGIEMSGRQHEGMYFAHAQEAIIATLSRTFFDEVIARDSVYKHEIELTNRIKDWMREYIQINAKNQFVREHSLDDLDNTLILPNSEVTYTMLSDTTMSSDTKFRRVLDTYKRQWEENTIFHERRMERKLFEEKLNKIVSASRGNLTKTKLFDEFARAHFSGNYLPLARTIESVLGRGSFRRIAMELGIEGGDVTP